MKTLHHVYFSSSASMGEISSECVDLIVTSPPYPMIKMWDQLFGQQDPSIEAALRIGDGPAAFELMHSSLDAVWRECARVVRPGGFVCINIGDATRSIGDNFRLYANHARVTSALESLGFQSLPLVLWRKQTNAPTKFLGSGMLPSGAYVTLEHEYILITRKGDKREFTASEREARRSSAYFWEERNRWFSDTWEFKGARQMLDPNDARPRSGAFPFELAFRLISMYSVHGDTVLDPFLGTGTTSAACAVAARNSIGYEITGDLASVISTTMTNAAEGAKEVTLERFRRHAQFVTDHTASTNARLRYTSEVYGFPVMTRQEVQLRLYQLDGLVEKVTGHFVGNHSLARPELPAAERP